MSGEGPGIIRYVTRRLVWRLVLLLIGVVVGVLLAVTGARADAGTCESGGPPCVQYLTSFTLAYDTDDDGIEDTFYESECYAFNDTLLAGDNIFWSRTQSGSDLNTYSGSATGDCTGAGGNTSVTMYLDDDAARFGCGYAPLDTSAAGVERVEGNADVCVPPPDDDPPTDGPVTSVELYQPLLQVVGFLCTWGLAMLTGLVFIKAGE